MADITLHRDNEFQRTVVPNYFIDAYMVHANGEYVKVYLYLLRCMNDPTMSFSISANSCWYISSFDAQSVCGQREPSIRSAYHSGWYDSGCFFSSRNFLRET